MKSKYDLSQKQAVISRYRAGESISRIIQDNGIPRSTIYNWLKLAKTAEDDCKEPILHNFRLLENKVKRLEAIIEILKTAECSPRDPLKVKLGALERLHEQHTYSVHMICEALDVPRGTFYNHVLRGKREHTWYAERRKELKEDIQEIYDHSHQIFGAEKITAAPVRKSLLSFSRKQSTCTGFQTGRT